MPSNDSLATLLRNGSITSAMHTAGERFHRTFVFAQLSSAAAPSLGRLRGVSPTGGGIPERVAAAESAVDRALSAVGGIASPGGSAVWFVVGLGYSVKEWAAREGWNGRALNPHEAKGVLVTALGVLVMHYGETKYQRKSLDRCTSLS